MLPHERMLKWNPETYSLEVVTDGIGATGHVALNVSPEDAPLLEASPDMARALLAHLKRHGERMTCGCWSCADARAALAKAGVPLP